MVLGQVGMRTSGSAYLATGLPFATSQSWPGSRNQTATQAAPPAGPQAPTAHLARGTCWPSRSQLAPAWPSSCLTTVSRAQSQGHSPVHAPPLPSLLPTPLALFSTDLLLTFRRHPSFFSFFSLASAHERKPKTLDLTSDLT